jgi:hypothetical protein
MPRPHPAPSTPSAELRGQQTEDRRGRPATPAPTFRPPATAHDLCPMLPCFTTHFRQEQRLQRTAAAAPAGRAFVRRAAARDGCPRGWRRARPRQGAAAEAILCHLLLRPLARPGGHSAEVPPDPIPNSAVKLRRAQGTAPGRGGRAGRRQVEPGVRRQMAEAQGSDIGRPMTRDRPPSPGVDRTPPRRAGCCLAARRARRPAVLRPPPPAPVTTRFPPEAQTRPPWSVLCPLIF